MKTKYLTLLVLPGLLSMFVACKKAQTLTVNETSLGFVEYQYTDTTVTPNVLAYKRFTLNNANYRVWANSTLPAPINAKYRQVEIFLSSDKAGHEQNPQPVGSSTVRISLVDTIATGRTADWVLPFKYTVVAGLQGFTSLPTLQPSCVGITANLNVLSNAGAEFSFSGQTQKAVQIIRYYNDGKYQIIANGSFNGKIYNISYLGELPKASDY